jgi:PilZ domain
VSTSYLPALDNVLNVIQSLSQQNSVLKLTRSFKGLLISQDVYIVDIEPGGATFQASDSRLCATQEGFVNLHSRLFPRPVVARMTEPNVDQGTFLLTDFAYIENQWTERRYERVHPKKPAHATMRWRRKAIRASVEDISVNGIGLLAYKLLEKGTQFQPGSHVLLDLPLLPDYEWTALRGTVIYVNPVKCSLVRIGLRLHLSSKEASSLENYIAGRKDEILEELELAYFEARKPRGVERLYF